MKLYLKTVVISICLVFVACEKRKAPVIPIQRVEPTPASTPTPTATPVATPQARLAPQGTFFVVKSFSVRTPDGLHGFPPGKKVTLVREDSVNLTVTDGVIEGKASKDSFTNDLDALDAMLAKATRVQQSAQQTQNSQQQMRSQQQASQSDAMAKEREEARKRSISASLTILRNQLDALNARIRAAANERESRGYPRYGGAPYNSGEKTHTKTLGTDASQIEALVQAKSQLESQIARVEAEK